MRTKAAGPGYMRDEQKRTITARPFPLSFQDFSQEPMIDAPPPTAKSRRDPTTWHITCLHRTGVAAPE